MRQKRSMALLSAGLLSLLIPLCTAIAIPVKQPPPGPSLLRATRAAIISARQLDDPTPLLGSIIIENSCRFPIFAWHAPPGRNVSVASAIDPFEHIAFQYQAIHNEVFDVLVSPDPLAVAKDARQHVPGSERENAGINNGDNQPGLAGPFTVFTYGLKGGLPETGHVGVDVEDDDDGGARPATMTYTLDNCNGDPFVGHQILLESSTGACHAVDWPAGVPIAPGQGQMWFDCPMSTWMTLTLCAETM
ncbi:hypothetical protein KEM52_001014 [Ascosphaera acerosa]|nr:hypothetical protein KEM52_001014 [Ascosphaera acerosa]